MLDIFYLTYHGDYSQENFEQIKKLAGEDQRVINVADIDGIYNGHKACALESKTKHFFVVDGDAWVLDDFDFSYIPNETDEVYPETCSAQCTHVWRALNPATGQIYGYGGVKLFARDAFMDKAYIDVEFPGVDVTTEVARRGYSYLPVETISNETRFATSPFNAWKSAFRETVKLASGVATQDRRKRINEWRDPSKDIPYSKEIALGAKMGENYGTANIGNGDRLFRINNWNWLSTWFKQRRNWKPLDIGEISINYQDGRYMLSGIQKYVEWKEHPLMDDIEECRRAVIASDEDAIRSVTDKLIWSKNDIPNLKLFLQYIQSGKKNRFNPERALHFMYEMYGEGYDDFFGTFMGAVVENKEVNYIDALSQFQVESKIWLIDELSNLDKHENAIFIGGWLGISSLWLGNANCAEKITNLDLDETAIQFSNKLNSYNYNYIGGIISDISEHDLSQYDLVINTSAEHMDDTWFESVPKGCTVAIQTNDFHEITEHINTVKDLTELREKYIMSEIYYIGVRDCDRYNRFMIIGKK
jgi:hypothetical protein